MNINVNLQAIGDLIEMALREDIGSGDITTDSVIPAELKARGSILSKSDGIVAGLDIAGQVFRIMDPHVEFHKLVSDGEQIHKGQEFAAIEGFARHILTAERTALNFLQRLSGIATLTARYVRAAAGYKAKIVDTRKTTPGWRVLEKYAVRAGGGQNHRFGLYDAVLIKDNHISAGGGISETIKRARERIPHTMKIEVEVESLEQLREAIDAGPDIIMLDNMDVNTMAEAVKLIDGKALVEASGGITLENIPQVAATGVDLISAGALTHSAMPLDISMSVVVAVSD